MIKIKKSKTADTRTCDVSKVTEKQLLESSIQHIEDIKKGLDFFKDMFDDCAAKHDHDKITGIKHFHSDFVTNFEQTGWWDNHRKVNRHHLLVKDGIPEDVNLIDVIEMITDCVMAGMGRSGSVYELIIDQDVLKNAFDNTVEMLKKKIVVDGE